MGATVISIISGIEGVLLLLVGLVLVLGLGLFGAGAAGAGAPAFGAVLAGVGIVFGVIVLVVAALYLAIAYGVWTRKGWAWMLGMVLSIIALVFAVLGLGGGISVSSLITLALPAIVLYFLWQPEVKRYLGRA